MSNEVKLSQASQAYIQQKTEVAKEDALKVEENQIEDGEKKINKGLAALGIMGAAVAAGVGIYSLSKGKTYKLENFNFKNIPSDLTGKVKGKLPNGDKLVMEYKNGALISSIRSGKVNFSKTYEEVNGEKIVKITKNGKTVTKNITKIQNNVKLEQQAIKSVLDKKDSLSSLDIEKEKSQIKHLSDKNKREINAAIIERQKQEQELQRQAQLKAEADAINAQKEAQKLAQEAWDKENIVIDAVTAVDAQPYKVIGKTILDDAKKNPKEYGSYSREALLKLKNTSIDEASKLGDYSQNPYDMPLKFMASANEAAAKNGTGLIVDEVPEMFEGIDKKELGAIIDNLRLQLDMKKTNHFTIGGKKFTAKHLGSGIIGNVYKITGENGQSVAVKYYKDPNLTGLQGAYAEIPIMRQASLDGVVDTPKFYMANPCGKYLDVAKMNDNVVGSWQMVEFIDENKPIRQGNIQFFDWLKSHGLGFGDYNKGTKVGNYVSDVGGVISRKDNYDPMFVSQGTTFMEQLLKGYQKNEKIDDILKVIE